MRRTPLVVLSTVVALSAPAAGAVLMSQATAGAAPVTPLALTAPVSDGTDLAVPHGLAVAAAAPAASPAATAAAHRPAARPTQAAKAARARQLARPHRTVRVAAAPAPVARPAAPKPAPKPATGTTTQARGTDDYPYRADTSGGFDPWGFTKRQCVSFVAWRLAQHGRALNNSRDNWGSALTWDDTARRLGRTVTTRPSVGAVAQWNAGESSPYYAPGSATANGHFTAGGYGHVAWVKAVYADGSVLVEQYNLGGDRAYSVMRVKAPRYLLL